MAERVLTGTRVRNRRIDLGLRQADVAKRVGISGSYLNLIEHNRRRIGAQLLGGLAQVLDVDEALLADETSASVVAPLKEAAADFAQAGADGTTAEDLVARFPAWASVISAQQARIAQLQARVEALGNRLAHDTQIATSLHEVISTATAIRSTASILAETPDLDADWMARFHHNIDGDSARLAQSSQALLGFLDVEAGARPLDAISAVEEAEAIFAARGFHLPAEEEGGQSNWTEASKDIVRQILKGWAKGYAADVAALPLQEFLAAARAVAFDPARLATLLGASLDLVLRRLAQLPETADVPLMGLVRCDSAGVVTFQKPVLDFRLPRAGAACPLWPLFQALSQPMRPLHAVVRLPGATRTSFECFAIATPKGDVAFGAEPQFEATMLVRPARSDAAARAVGPGCRVCPIEDCASRRQPSVVGSQF